MYVYVRVRVQYEYEFDERGDRVVLGKGTFGTVYAGRELTTQVKIAIKEFKESSSSECACPNSHVPCATPVRSEALYVLPTQLRTYPHSTVYCISGGSCSSTLYSYSYLTLQVCGAM